MITFTCPDGCSHSLELASVSLGSTHGLSVITGTMIVDSRRVPFRQAISISQLNEMTDTVNLILNPPVHAILGKPTSS